MHARRGHADHDVARAHVLGLGQDVPALDRADGKSREIEIVLGVKARHLRRLAADQRAAGFAAGLGDAFDDDRRIVDVELSARVIVEEEQRLGALHDDVVHAHGDEILAERLKAARLDGDPELGADAVRRGDQHGIVKAGSLEIEEAAEAAQRRVRARPAGRLGKGCDSVDQRLAAIDIDARVLVGERNSCRDQRSSEPWARRHAETAPRLRVRPPSRKTVTLGNIAAPASLALPWPKAARYSCFGPKVSPCSAIAFLLMLGLACAFSLAGAHAAEDPFTVSGISVDATAASASVAQNIAINQGRGRGLEHAL